MSATPQTPASLGPTVDLEGAAEIMKVHPKTVQDLIGEGVLRAARIGRAYVLLTRDVLEHTEREIIQQTAARMRSIPGRTPPPAPRARARAH